MADHMIVGYREKGEKWVQQAEKAQRRPYMDTLTRYKYHDASSYLELAAQCFRVAKRFQDAGAAYKQCGRLEEKLKKPGAAACFYHEAALCFRKEDPQEAAACFCSSVNLYCQIQSFSTAARLETEVAELMERDRNRPLAIQHWIKAANFYKANTCCDKATDRCLVKAAIVLGQCERYVEAASLFEEVGRRMLVDDLLKFNSPSVFLRAILCMQCAGGMVEAPVRRDGARGSRPAAPQTPTPTYGSLKAKIASLAKTSAVFRGSREYLFASDVVRAWKLGDLAFFADRVYAFDNVCRMSAWYLRLLKTISEQVEAKGLRLGRLRAKQDKIRRKQLAEERARELKSRQARPTQIGGLSPQPSSSEENSGSSSSDTTRLARGGQNAVSQDRVKTGSPSASSQPSDASTESTSAGSSSEFSSSSGSESDWSSSGSSESGVSPQSGSRSASDSSSRSSSSGESNSGVDTREDQEGNSGVIGGKARTRGSATPPRAGDGSGSDSSPLSTWSTSEAGGSRSKQGTGSKSRSARGASRSKAREGWASESESGDDASESIGFSPISSRGASSASRAKKQGGSKDKGAGGDPAPRERRGFFRRRG